MRVTFVLPPPGMSGGIRVIGTYAERLAQRGHKVTIVHPPNPRPSLRARVRQLIRGERWMLLPRVNPSYLDDVPVPKHTLDDYRPVCDADVPDADVVVATWWETAEWVVRLSPAKGAKAFFLQGFEVYGAQPAERVRRTWSFPMHKIVIAQWLADVARREFNDDWVTVVPNSVDTRQFDAPVRGKQRTPTVGYLYSSVACKGCDRVIEAVRAARRALPALDVLAFGASSESEPPGLPEGCRYHRSPKQTELAAIYAACDAWLFASMAEGFGLPILEAMACRTPVIGTPAGAAPELIGMGGGIPLESFSPDEMAYAIVKIARMPDEEWRRMSACAYATARGYSWDDATDRFEVALKRAMTGRPAGLMDGVGA